MTRRLCFVLMPFGKKPDASGGLVDFDAVYHDLIAPAIADAELDPLRADEEMTGGIIHKPMFERLILCEYAVADLTTANANVFYELGVRHAVRPASTVIVFAEGGRLPFDVALLRALPYRLSAGGTPMNVDQDKAALARRLREAHKTADDPEKDSPIYQLVEDYPDIDRTKTEVFREQVQNTVELKARLGLARREGLDALRACENEFNRINDLEPGVVIDLFLSYRSVKAWAEMIELVKRMPRHLAQTVMVQEQLALALNRAGRGEDAETVLTDLLRNRGPSSETYGILGRVYKDRWEAALKRGETLLARGLLNKAIEAFLRGFEANWSDAYPGVITVTLMELKDPPDARRTQLIPIVAYAVERRIASGKADYWDYATRLELAVLEKNAEKALEATEQAIANMRERWEAETTARNLRLIREAGERRQEEVSWVHDIEKELNRRSNP